MSKKVVPEKSSTRLYEAVAVDRGSTEAPKRANNRHDDMFKQRVQGKAVGKARKASYVVYAEAKRMIEASSTRERAQETSLRRAARDTGSERERGKLGRAKNLEDRVYVLTLGFR